MLIILFLVLIATLIYYYAQYKYSYWKRRGIPYLQPIFPIGNCPTSLPKGISLGMISKQFYDKFKPTGCRLGGVYFWFEPKLVIMDPTYAEDILKSDFSHFVDRGTYYNKDHPLTVNIFTQEGNEWRATRGKFSPMFTTAKLKVIFQTLLACNQHFEEHLKYCAEKEEFVNITEIVSNYYIEVIGSVVCGVDCNSFKKPDDQLKTVANIVFRKFSLLNKIQMYLALFHPNLAKSIGVTNIQKEVTEFFTKIISDTVAYREKNSVRRMDFLQLLIDARKENNITVNDMVAQTFLFFIAGYETPANTAAFMLFELGLQQNIQDEIRREIKTVLEKYNKIEVDYFKEMPLLDRAFKETTRKYSASGTILRRCIKDYTFKNTNLTIPKGMTVLIPFFGYQRDPDYFPDPERWDPDRFLDNDKKHVGYFPFGDGPRNCIGLKFGILQVKMAVLSIIKDYKVTVDPSIKVPLEFDQDTFLTYPTETIMLKFHKF